ncbi:MAG TPA: Rieske 2Fe-2S domain-containing protein [Chloroflexota bacterium]|nr:Rieske 2Fe-2S domain-containing protein [Chloroflexota bacterium]
MLTREENDLLTRTGPGTPMGELLRRYWMPALLASELEADGEPKQVMLLSQRFVAFRDSQGRVGLLDENCPHRGASLAYGRNEQCGLRCIYHGWKVDVDGNILDTPSEPEDSTFKQRIKQQAYGVHEVGGLIWVYLGPPNKRPPFPAWEWTHAPANQLEIDKVWQDCNYAQGLEGSIDSVHSDFLHSVELRDRPSDHRPSFEVEDRPYGFRYAAIRRPDSDPERLRYVRVTLFMAPCYVLTPPQRRGPDYEIMNHQAWVPIDDEHNFFFSMRYNRAGPLTENHGAQFQRSEDFRPARKRANKHLQDRAAMKNGNWTGIQGVNSQDFAVVESMGPIYDRTREHLGSTDVAIARFRRWMIYHARALAEGVEPPGLDGTFDYPRLASEEKIVPVEMPWQEVAPCS